MSGLPFIPGQEVYIKLLPHLEQYAKPLVPAGAIWQDTIFGDITENGTSLTVELLPDSTQGPRWGLCGEQFYCEGTRDRVNKASIFVYRIDPAGRRDLKSVPVKWTGSIGLLKSNVSAPEIQRRRDHPHSPPVLTDTASADTATLVDR